MFSLRLEEKVELSVEISNPAGAVRVIGPAIALPFTVKDCDPDELLKSPSELAEGEIKGNGSGGIRRERARKAPQLRDGGSKRAGAKLLAGYR